MFDDMSKSNIIDKIHRSLKTILWRRHARIEAENDNISESGLEDALRTGFTIVEHYPDDPRGESALVLAFVNGNPVHVVLALRGDLSYLITVYVPEGDKWDETFTRRKGK